MTLETVAIVEGLRGLEDILEQNYSLKERSKEL